MNFRPTYDNLLIKEDAPVEKIGSISIPVNSEIKHVMGEVLEVGPGMYNEAGTMLPLLVKKGDRVLFAKASAKETKLGNQTYLILKETDVIGIIEE